MLATSIKWHSYSIFDNNGKRTATTALKKENLEFFVEECQTKKESIPRLFIRGPYGLLFGEEKYIHHGWI